MILELENHEVKYNFDGSLRISVWHGIGLHSDQVEKISQTI